MCLVLFAQIDARPEVNLYTSVLDNHLDSNGYIVSSVND